MHIFNSDNVVPTVFLRVECHAREEHRPNPRDRSFEESRLRISRNPCAQRRIYKEKKTWGWRNHNEIIWVSGQAVGQCEKYNIIDV